MHGLRTIAKVLYDAGMSPERALAVAILVFVISGCTKQAQPVTGAPIAVATFPPPPPRPTCADGERWDGHACERIPQARTPRPAPALTHDVRIGSGLLLIHHGDDLQVNEDSEALLFLEPTPDSKLTPHALVAFITNQNPVSQDLVVYGEALQGAREKALTQYSLLSRTPGRCFQNLKGIETRWAFAESGTMMQGRACAFLHNSHGYSFMYAFDPQKPEDEARLRAVVEATEMTD